MNHARRSKSIRLGTVESLEGRSLLSGATVAGAIASARSAIVGQIASSAITVDPGGAAAITSALGGGIGSEWATLIRRQVRNPLSIVRAFSSGQTAAYSIRGVTFRTPASQPEFTGRAYDQLLPTVAGASVFRGNVLELAAVMRGEFRNPETSSYVFALDRGNGGRFGPTFASRPGITPDALVTVTVGPYGSSASGTIHDLTKGTTTAFDASKVKIQGATIRVFLDASQLFPRGTNPARARFAMWTQTQPGNTIANVAGFAPEASMVAVGVYKNIAVRR